MKWCNTSSPPTLHIRRLGQYGHVHVSRNQYHPYEMYEKSKYLKDESLFPHFQNAVLALWQLKKTRNPRLQHELTKILHQEQLPRAKLIDQLTWCVQMTPPQFQLCWPSV